MEHHHFSIICKIYKKLQVSELTCEIVIAKQIVYHNYIYIHTQSVTINSARVVHNQVNNTKI